MTSTNKVDYKRVLEQNSHRYSITQVLPFNGKTYLKASDLVRITELQYSQHDSPLFLLEASLINLVRGKKLKFGLHFPFGQKLVRDVKGTANKLRPGDIKKNIKPWEIILYSDTTHREHTQQHWITLP